MLTLSLESMLWAAATFVYLVLIGGLLLKRAANKDDARITQPFISMAQVAFISGIVFALASVPSYVARIVNPNVLPFIMPYAPILFAISFVVFIKKLDSKRSGRYQAGVALWLAALITSSILVAQIVQRAMQ